MLIAEKKWPPYYNNILNPNNLYQNNCIKIQFQIEEQNDFSYCLLKQQMFVFYSTDYRFLFTIVVFFL